VLIPLPGGGVLDFSFYAFQLGPDPDFGETAGNPAGTIAKLFTSPVHNFAGDFTDPTAPVVMDDGTLSKTVPPSAADVSIGPYDTENKFGLLATDGTPLLTLGFLGLPGEGIAGTTTSAFDNVLPFFTNVSGASLANFNLGLNVLAYGPAFPTSTLTITRTTPSLFCGGCTVDMFLSEQLKGVADLDTPFEVASNLNGSFQTAPIPEPTTLFLFGGGLVSLGVLLRRRQKA
jgi:hypothetical protein